MKKLERYGIKLKTDFLCRFVNSLMTFGAACSLYPSGPKIPTKLSRGMERLSKTMNLNPMPTEHNVGMKTTGLRHSAVRMCEYLCVQYRR
jgi:hypothetical protein